MEILNILLKNKEKLIKIIKSKKKLILNNKMVNKENNHKNKLI